MFECRKFEVQKGIELSKALSEFVRELGRWQLLGVSTGNLGCGLAFYPYGERWRTIREG